MKTKPWTRKGFTLVELLVVIAIIVALAALATPAILKQRKKMDMTQAISNSKQIYLVLMDFESDKGTFPSDITAGTDAALSTFLGAKNLGQLIGGGYTTSEEIFYSKGGNPAGNIKPDDVITLPADVLKAGENGFAYVTVTGGSPAVTRGLSTSDNGGMAILVTPVTTGGSSAVCKPDPFDNRGVYLRVDGSARAERLTAAFEIKIGSAGAPPVDRLLFDAGAGTVWAGYTPVVTLPE